MVDSFDLADYRKRMDGAILALRSDFSGLRTGRANAALLDGITIEAYGAQVALNQVASINVPEARMLSVNIWDKTHVAAVEKALRQSSLGFNPVVDGMTLRIPMPPLTEERRKDLCKIASGYSENAKIAVRNVRRDAMDRLKHMEKEGHMGEDEHKAHSQDVQDATDHIISEIDKALKTKTEEIMQV